MVVVRRTTRVSPLSSRSTANVVSADVNGQRLVPVGPAERHLLAAEHDHSVFEARRCSLDRLDRRPRGAGRAGRFPRSRRTWSKVRGLARVRSSSRLSRS